jgi:cytochrome b
VIAEARVWDPLVRAGHWTLVTATTLAWLFHKGTGGWHERLGYLALGVVAVRVVWGFAGPRHARFASFVRRRARTLAYARDVIAGREARYLGHNPLGGWMVLALLAAVVATGASGWLMTTDRFWGVEWVEENHEALANGLPVLVVLHVGGVIFTGKRHGENLVRAMVNGTKRGAAPGDVD